ncbi:MAG: trypsin-like peptidase domain-containing protein [Spirochaetaceae bacterium]|nr:trypsin-like peptidase domain-containing protein [Spirochaetaceae bacterium]
MARRRPLPSGDPVRSRLFLVLVGMVLLAGGCATTRGPALPPAASTAYFKADIERQLAAGEPLRALQNIWSLETSEPARVPADDLRGLRRRAIRALRDDLEVARREQRYLDAVALAQSLAAVGGDTPSAHRASLTEFYHGEVQRLIGAGRQVSALITGLRAARERLLPADYLPVLRDLAVEARSRYALAVLADAVAAGGRELPVPELPPPASYEEMLAGTVTVWVDRGVAIRRGVGYPDRVIGSGFFIDRDGHLLTNYHVISSEVDPAYEGYSRLYIRLSEQPDERVTARVVGYDPVFDLALLKAEVTPQYVFSAVSGAHPAPGDPITAIGTPGDISLAKTVTSGIVSAVGRRFLQVGDALQVDAPLNPGNSGGPLLNADRDLVGITFAGMEQFEGINFGIAAEWIERVLPKLYEGGAVSHLWLGVSVHRRDAGLVVDYVLPGGPADLAGVAAGDVLVRFGDYAVEDIVGVQRHLLGFPAPALVEVEVRRGGRERLLLALLGPRPFSPLDEALQRDSWQDVLVPLFGLGVEHVRRSLFRDEYRVTAIVPGSVADDSRISLEDPVWLEEFALDEESRTAYLRLVVRGRLTGTLEASVLLSAPLEQANLL